MSAENSPGVRPGFIDMSTKPYDDHANDGAGEGLVGMVHESPIPSNGKTDEQPRLPEAFGQSGAFSYTVVYTEGSANGNQPETRILESVSIEIVDFDLIDATNDGLFDRRVNTSRQESK